MKVAYVVIVQHLLHMHIAKASNYVIVHHWFCRKPVSFSAKDRCLKLQREGDTNKTFFFLT